MQAKMSLLLLSARAEEIRLRRRDHFSLSPQAGRGELNVCIDSIHLYTA
jgi:hypothetical protein